MAAAPQRPDRWEREWRIFIEDSMSIRRNIAERDTYFQNYNENIAPMLRTRATAFNVWANLLAATHPRHGDDGIIIRLCLEGEEQDGYDTHYRFVRTVVHTLGDCVYHYLEPLNDLQARSIILFRGTTKTPAIYMDSNRVQQEEPSGYWADTNVVSVASTAYIYIRSDISSTLKNIATAGRHVTLIGHSLGGAFAMRALKHHCKHENVNIWSEAHLFVFSAVGVGWWAARRLKGFFNTPARQLNLRAYWHRDDPIAKTGHYPNTTGTVYKQKDPQHPRNPLPRLNTLDSHTLPLISIDQGWLDHGVSYPHPATKPKYTGVGQFGRNGFRQLGGILATLWTPYTEIRSNIHNRRH